MSNQLMWQTFRFVILYIKRRVYGQ
jgi:hypothetical protein